MNRSFAAAAVVAASLAAAPLSAQLAQTPVPTPDPAGDVVPGGALPPAPAPVPEPSTGALPTPVPPSTSAVPAPALPAPALPAPAPGPAIDPTLPVPAEPAPPVAQTFSDADVTTFARAVIAIDPIQADTTLDETQKQAKMAEALASAGIAVDIFNAMAVQSRSDTALKTRIQTQIAALQAAQPPAG